MRTSSSGTTAALGARGLRPASGRPTIISAICGRAERCGVALAHDAAITHHRDAVGEGLYLGQLVRDEHDGDALGIERPQHREQLVHFLRRQHRGRLVEDQHARAVMQRLEDLDPLLDADRELADARARIHRQAVARRQLADLRVRRGAPQAAERAHRLVAQHDVLAHRQRVDQHEVLMHHAETEAHRVGGPMDVHAAAIHLDRAGVGLEQPVEHAHQRALAGAVLADQRMNLARAKVERDRIVGNDGTEAPGDAAQRDRGCEHSRASLAAVRGGV
jgi:hypothetical protein